MNTKKVYDEVVKTLEKYDKNYTSRGIEILVNTWDRAKINLRNVLSKHKNWNEDAQAVIMTTQDERRFDKIIFRDCMWEIMGYFSTNISSFYVTKAYLLLSSLRNYTNSPYVNSHIKDIFAQFDVKVNEGQKISRCIAKFIKGTEYEKLPEYNKFYAKLADSLSPLQIERNVIISIHPCDYLEMSNGNSWSSCHGLDDGCYMAGTLSYMGDETSMILYTIDKSYNGNEYFGEKKINRQVFSYKDNMILQSRLYPDDDRLDGASGEGKITNYRNIVQSVFSECLNIPNLWVLKKNSEVLEYVQTYRKSLHYPDYTYSQYNSTLSILKDYEPNINILIGSPSYCLKCGDQIEKTDELYCNSCTCDYTCDKCGKPLHEDDVYWVGDGTYCYDCLDTCSHCGDYKVAEDLIPTNDGSVCDSCLNNYYVWSDYHDEYYYEEGMIYVEDREDYFFDSEVVEIDGEFYFEDDAIQCSDCLEYVLKDNAYHDEDGNTYCENCYKEIEVA